MIASFYFLRFTFYALTLSLIAACAPDQIRKLDDNIHTAIETFAKDIRKITEQIESDDRILREALQSREHTSDEEREIDAFLTRRRRVLKQLEESLEELRSIDTEVHGLVQLEEALGARLDAQAERRRATYADFEELRQRDTEIRKLLGIE